MSARTNIIRGGITHTGYRLLGAIDEHPSFCTGCEAEAALDALAAENQQLRDALERIATAEPSSQDATTLAQAFVLARGQARAALDGTP